MSKLAFSHVSAKSGKTYYLHSREVTLRSDREQTIYYFAGQPGDHALSEMPTGYKVEESGRTGMPYLKKA